MAPDRTIGKLQTEPYREVVANQVPVALPGVELHLQTTSRIDQLHSYKHWSVFNAIKGHKCG